MSDGPSGHRPRPGEERLLRNLGRIAQTSKVMWSAATTVTRLGQRAAEMIDQFVRLIVNTKKNGAVIYSGAAPDQRFAR